MDRDEDEVQTLRESDIEAIHGDLTDPETFTNIDFSEVKAALILTNDSETNLTTLKHIKKISNEVYCIIRASDSLGEELLKKNGADQVFVPSNMAAKNSLDTILRLDVIIGVMKLVRVLKSLKSKKIAIMTHDNPDPDTLASAMCLGYIASIYDIESDILYGGEVGHQETRAMVNLLEIPMTNFSDIDISEYDSIALIDTAIPGQYNSLEPETSVDIVIDHHSLELVKVKAKYVDIQKVGATSTILANYVKELKLSIDKPLATALFFGIWTDTQDFKRDTTSYDLEAAAYLYSQVDHETLKELESPSMALETLNILGEAIANKQIKGSFLISHVGTIRDRDALAQAADYLLNLEGISTVLVFGLNDEHIMICGRNADVRFNLSDVLKRAFGDIGSAGGHATSAAAQIPLGVFSKIKDKFSLMKLSEEAVIKRFLVEVGADQE